MVSLESAPKRRLYEIFFPRRTGQAPYHRSIWSDHRHSCEKCQAVDIERTATIANVCAIGAPLLNEELAKLRAPVVKQKNKEVADWADKAGVFPTAKAKTVQVKYKE